MLGKKKMLIMYLMEALHYVALLALFVSGWWVFYRMQAMNGGFVTNSALICGIYALLLYLFSQLYDAYKVGTYRVGALLYSQVLTNLVSLGLTYAFACILARKMITPLACFGIAAVQTAVSIIWLLLANKLYFFLNAPKDTLVIYHNEADLEKLGELRYLPFHWRIVESVRVDEELSQEAYSSLKSVMNKYSAVFVSGTSATQRNDIEKYCVENEKECYFVPHTGDIITMGAKHMRSFAVPICQVAKKRLTPNYLFFKRCLDLALSVLGIVLFCPIMLIIAAAIKCQDGGSVFYRQARLTKDGRVFQILKFRSMRMDAERDGQARLASCNDDRITPVGKLIRTVRMDELPQLFNIFRGEMSIVGPRPERPEIAAEYAQKLPDFALRLQVKSGLTGYAQIYGRYNTEPQDKLKLDLMYINRMSMYEDLKMIFATMRILFMRESTQGVAEGQTTAAKEIERSA